MAKSWYPTGTTYSGTSPYTATPPTGWTYIGKDNSGAPFSGTAGLSVSCTCTGTGSCTPMVFQTSEGEIGACVGNCSACNMSVTTTTSSGGITIGSGGLYNSSLGVAVLLKTQALPGPIDELFSNTAFQNAVDTYLTGVYGTSSYPQLTVVSGSVVAPSGSVVAFANA